MAKISIEFDTLEKELSVTVDGTPLENVSGVSIYPGFYDSDGDEYHCSITTREKDDDHDLIKMTTLCASESVDAKSGRAVASSLEGFVEIPGGTNRQVNRDIAAYFGRR